VVSGILGDAIRKLSLFFKTKEEEREKSVKKKEKEKRSYVEGEDTNEERRRGIEKGGRGGSMEEGRGVRDLKTTQ
jgi:hypothetical protein